MKGQRGVTFVGVVVTVVVIAVLAALALGGYDYGLRMYRRSAAQDCLGAAAAALKRAHAMTSTFQGAAIPSCPAELAQYYSDVSFASGPSDDAYTLQIAPLPGSEQAKDACGRMTLDNAGKRTADSAGFCM